MSANTHHTATPAEGLTFYMKDEHHPEQSTMIGFWIYLMSDCLIFAILFATYAVLGHSFAGGPTAKELFDLKLVAINTAMLLFSSITYGFAMLEMEKGNKGLLVSWLVVTFFFGACFLGIELYEFHHLIEEGAGPGAAPSCRPSSRSSAPTVCTSPVVSSGWPCSWSRSASSASTRPTSAA